MNSNEFFHCYNVQLMKKNKILSCFVVLSILFSVAISLAIPQVVIGLEEYWATEARLKNGADLKVECSSVSNEFERVIEKIRETHEVEKRLIFNAVIKKEKQQHYCDLILGKYELAENEVIISSNLAESLSVSEGDILDIFDTQYVIKKIEASVRGVGKQGGELGYAKVANYSQDEKYAYSNLYLISGDNIQKVKEELINAEPSFLYTLVEDVEKESEAMINTNAMSLNMINTMCVIMTVISLISSIFLILSQCERDIAIMKTESIQSSIIKKGFQRQFLYYIVLAVVLGAASSMVLSLGMLKYNGVPYQPGVEELIRIFIGIVFLILVYAGYARIAYRRIDDISALSVLRSEVARKKNGHIMKRSIVLTLVFFWLYAMYIEVMNVFSISLLITVLMGFFYLLFLAVIRIFTCIPARKAVNKYLFLHLREKKHSVTLTVMSLAFTILFFLIGFTLSETIADSYSKGLKEKINYNYMLNAQQEESISDVLKQSEDTGWYTKLSVMSANLCMDGVAAEETMLVAVDKEVYGVKYQMKQGEDVVSGECEGVMLSESFAGKYGYKLKDTITLEVAGYQIFFEVKGLYESGGMNEEHIIVNQMFADTFGAPNMYLVSSKHPSVIEQMENVYIVNLDTIGNSLRQTMEKTLGIFKAICVLCVFSAIVFNINIMYMKTLEDHRNLVLMRALGIHKHTLTKNVIIECLLMLVLTLAMSLGVYYFLITFAVNVMFQTEALVTLKMIFAPLALALVLIFGIFTIPLTNMKKSKFFDELREMV